MKKKKSVIEAANDWFVKNKFLQEQIEILEGIKGITLISITTFLFKAQWIEFSLRQLITTLDLHLRFSNQSKTLKRKITLPIELDDKPLGSIIKRLQKYQNPSVEILVQHLNGLNKYRKKFTHHLFGRGSFADLQTDAKKGNILASKILKEIESINKLLDENDPLKTNSNS